MKNYKKFFLVNFLTLLFGIGCFSFNNLNLYKADAVTEQVIHNITAAIRVAGQNNKTFIRFACNDVCGAYQNSYEGYAYDEAGNPLPLILYQQGGAGGNTWVQGGTRLFELKTDSSDFINAINSGDSFYITNGSVFTDGAYSITFEKEYVFEHIYDGRMSFHEVVSNDITFDIEEMEYKVPDTEKYRIGIKNLKGIDIPFTDVFEGKVFDLDGNAISATLYDGQVGTTAKGNRRFYIELSTAVKDDTFYLKDDSNFKNTTLNKQIKLQYIYKITAKSVDYCNGKDHHILGPVIEDERGVGQECEVCGYSTFSAFYLIKIGNTDKYCQATESGNQFEIGLKIGGCSGYDTGKIPEVFRGSAKLNDETVALKITVNGNIVRIYTYVNKTHKAIVNGIISINETDSFKADADGSLLKFSEGLKFKYNTNIHKYRVDPINYKYKDSIVSNVVTKNWVSKTNDEVVISYINVKLSNGLDCLSSSSTYRGNAKVDGKDMYIVITLQKVNGSNKLAFFFNGNITGTLEISLNTKFELDCLGTRFTDETNVPDEIKFEKDLVFNYDAENNLINPTNTVLSLSGIGTWSQALDTTTYNVMCSFDDCSINGISEDNSEIHPETLKHRGYHFYGKGYNKDNESEVVDVDIWLSAFKNTDDTLENAIVKTAIYTNLSSVNKGGIKLHKDDLFICSAYNLTLRLDDDYLVKWYVNSSRTTAGKYNNDKVGPTINVDMNNLPSFIEGDEKPTLPVSVNDDVDDYVPVRSQTWEEGALDENNCLIKGLWKVTLTATDSSGNDAIPIEIMIAVNEKQEEDKPIEQPVDTSNNNQKGCSGNITSSIPVISLLAIIGLSIIIIKKIAYK